MSADPASASVRAILLDIEGTTTPVAFVYDVLFPYARRRLRPFLEGRGRAAETEDFEALMDRDSKTTALKALQGQIWEEGYRTGDLVGEVFADVPAAFQRWRAAGIELGIFSSGSVLAQQLLFAHSTSGDLTRFLRWYFDTTTGAKADPDSYRRIAAVMNVPAHTILFVSDTTRELDAAREAGMQTRMAMRPGNAPSPVEHGHQPIGDFNELFTDPRS